MIDSAHTERIAAALERIAEELKEQNNIMKSIYETMVATEREIDSIETMLRKQYVNLEGLVAGNNECRRAGLL